MPTTGIMSGTLLRVYVGANPIAYATEGSFSLSRELIEQLHKDNASGDWPSRRASTKNATISCSALYADDATSSNFNELFTAFNAGTALTVMISSEVSGDDFWSGSFLISSLELNATDKEDANYSVTFESTGAVTMAQVT